MEARSELLVAIINHPVDLAIAREQHWYRIPVRSAEKWLKDRWPPQWVAFYQTKIFGDQAYAIHFYARVLRIHQAFRWQFFPGEPRDEKGMRRYHQLLLSPLQQLPQPILSRRRRRIIFIPTTWEKFVNAEEINDLYDESPLEDRLWAEFKQRKISAERQEFVQVNEERAYSLDFAIHCASGQIDVETDGDTWHAGPERIPLDNLRDNDLGTVGWHILRFNTHQVREQMAEYCVPTVVENITRLGGVDEGKLGTRQISLEGPGSWQQLSLFEQAIEDDVDW